MTVTWWVCPGSTTLSKVNLMLGRGFNRLVKKGKGDTWNPMSSCFFMRNSLEHRKWIRYKYISFGDYFSCCVLQTPKDGIWFFQPGRELGVQAQKAGSATLQKSSKVSIEFFESSSSGGVLGHRSLWRSHSPRLTPKHDWMPLSLRRHGVVIGRGMLWPQWGKAGNLLSGTLPSSWENWPEETFVWTGPRWIHDAFCSPRDPVKMQLQFYCLSFEATQCIQSIEVIRVVVEED